MTVNLETFMSLLDQRGTMTEKDWCRAVMRLCVESAYCDSDSDVPPADPGDVVALAPLYQEEAYRRAYRRALGAVEQAAKTPIEIEEEHFRRIFAHLVDLRKQREQIPFYRFRRRCALARVISSAEKVDTHSVLSFLCSAMNSRKTFERLGKNVVNACYGSKKS